MGETPVERLVRTIAVDGIRDTRVLDAIRATPRERFVPDDLRGAAYDNTALPIGYRQTISQPGVVAMMTEALAVEPHMRVLEIGTGSGYQAAVLARLAAEVYSVEIVAELGERARHVLAELGVANVHIRVADGNAGWPEEAPFDRIIATAAAKRLPPKLLEQLAADGVLVMPLEEPNGDQNLVRVTKGSDGRPNVSRFCPVRFVPFVGDGNPD